MRRAVTLVELLITMTIMAIIAAAILGVAAQAIESSRAKKTQSVITKIAMLIDEKFASYETRRIPLHPDYESWIDFSFSNTQNRGLAMQDCRVLAVRELQKFEMPDRWSDVYNAPLMLASVPQLAAMYRRVYDPDPNKSGDEASTNHQGAECLYLTVMAATGDGEARGMFNPDQIGDVDEDGRKEFIDGWGQPITWLRWPTGYTKSTVMSGDGQKDHDTLDVYMRDLPNTSGPLAIQYKVPPPGSPGGASIATGGILAGVPVSQNLTPLLPTLRDNIPGFRMVPLVFSIGPDGEQGVTSKDNAYIADLDPFTATEPVENSEDRDKLPGTPYLTDASADDITSHQIDY